MGGDGYIGDGIVIKAKLWKSGKSLEIEILRSIDALA
jgi:hypothetical protein